MLAPVTNPAGCVCPRFTLRESVVVRETDFLLGGTRPESLNPTSMTLHRDPRCPWSEPQRYAAFVEAAPRAAHVRRPADVEADGVCTGACRRAGPWRNVFQRVRAAARRPGADPAVVAVARLVQHEDPENRGFK